VVVAVAFLVMFVNYGVRSTQTVLIKGFSEDLGIGRAAASLPFTVCVLVYAFLAPLTGRLVDRFGPRWVMTGGALLSGVGLWMCSRANSLAALVFFFGILFGVGGNGIGLVPSNTSVAAWFREKLGLALGVATMGIGFGTMILPRLTGLVQARWDWRASFQFLGYTALALAVPAFFLLRGKGKEGEPALAGERGRRVGRVPPPQEGRVPEGQGESGGGDAAAKGAADAAAQGDPGGGSLTLGMALKTASFWSLFTGFVLIVIALYGVMVHQVPYLTDRGIERSWAEWSIVVCGATSVAGRVFFGRLSDRVGEKKKALYPACFVLLAGIALLLLVRGVGMMMLFALVFGFGFAAYGPVIPAVCAEVFGKANMGSIFGAVTTGGALGGAAGPVITGFIFDRTGSYAAAWLLALACVLLSTFLFSRVRLMVPRGPWAAA